MILFIKNEKTWSDVVGVEIGTLRGLNAVSIVQNLNIKQLYLVDPYILYDDGINAYQNRTKDYKIAQQNVKAFKDKVTFVTKKSEDAVDDIPNDLDFVYIDGNHSYEYVKKDIEMYYPKVKPGGILGGHDFRAGFYGLCTAVLEFANEHQINLYGDHTDWWFVKS